MKSHRADLLSLGFGLLFLVVGIAGSTDVLDLRLLDGDWLWAIVLIGAGVAVLLTVGGRDDHDAEIAEAAQAGDGAEWVAPAE